MSHGSLSENVTIVRRNVTRVGVRTATRTVTKAIPGKAVTRQVVGRTAVRHIGPAGLNGAEADSYTHAQGSASSTWTVPHNLGRRPNVELRTVGGVVMLGQVTHVSDNLLTVSFAYAIAGTARMI